MSKKQSRRRPAAASARCRRSKVTAAITLALVCVVGTSLLAQVSSKGKGKRDSGEVSVMSLSPGGPSKEYIYAGGRLVATEEPTNTSTVILPRQLGVFFTDNWRLDHNGNNVWDGTPTDKLYQPFGISGDIAVAGDWTGNGISKIGVFRIESGLGKWYLDINGNGIWNGDVPGGDKIVLFGQEGDKPVVGNWNGIGGTSKIGVFRKEGQVTRWYLDLNGNSLWDGDVPGGDKIVLFGVEGDVPVAGDWNGIGGTSKIGVFRKEGQVTRWYLDFNGNDLWDGDGNGDTVVLFGEEGDKPVVGDWNGSGSSKIGVFRITIGLGSWLVDYDGDTLWEITDQIYSFGQSGDQPVVGKW